MANLEFDISDPRSEWYSPANQSGAHEGGMLNAVIEGRGDEITKYDRYRTWPKIGRVPNKLGMEMGIQPTPSISYTTKVPPWLAGSLTDQLAVNPDPNILPLNSFRDPNYAYAQYAYQDRHASNLNNTWKTIVGMPLSESDDADFIGRRNDALETLSEKFQIASKKAEEHKARALELQTAYNRQIGIQNLRQWDAGAHEDAQAVEQASRDFSLIDRGIASGRIQDTRWNDELRNKAMLNLERKMDMWDSKLEKRGFMGAKGPYLLSGVPLQGLDDLSDNAMRNMKLASEKVQMFQSRYTNDAPFRASVNEGLKAKVPGIIGAGVGGYLVKQKIDEGQPIHKAIVETAGDIVAASAKFALWDKFVGPASELNQGEQKFLDEKDRVKFTQTLSNAKMKELERDFPHLSEEKNKVANIIRERLEQSSQTEQAVLTSPLWNKQR